MGSRLTVVQPGRTLMMRVTRVQQKELSIDMWDRSNLDDALDGTLGHVIKLWRVWVNVGLHGVNY